MSCYVCIDRDDLVRCAACEGQGCAKRSGTGIDTAAGDGGE